MNVKPPGMMVVITVNIKGNNVAKQALFLKSGT